MAEIRDFWGLETGNLRHDVQLTIIPSWL